MAFDRKEEPVEKKPVEDFDPFKQSGSKTGEKPVQATTDRVVGAEPGKDSGDWTVLTAADAYSKEHPYVAKQGEHVRAYESYVDAKFGSVVIGDQKTQVTAEAGSTVKVQGGAVVDAYPGADVTIGRKGDTAWPSHPGARLTIEAGADFASVGSGVSAEVKAGGKAWVSKGGEAHAQEGAQAHVTEGGRASAENGAHLEVDFGGSFTGKPGADIRANSQYGDHWAIKSGSVTDIPDGGKSGIHSKYLAEANTKVSIGEGSVVQALGGSEILARDKATVLAEAGAVVNAQPGARVIAKPGAIVHASPGATVASADATVDFENLTDQYIYPGLSFSNKSHFVGNYQVADSDNSIIPENARGVKVYGDHDWVIGGNTFVTAMPGSKVRVIGSDEYHRTPSVVAEGGSQVTAGPHSNVEAKPGSNVIAMIDTWVDARQGSFVDARNGAHVNADKGANILRHIETDMREDKGANLTWKPSLGQRMNYYADRAGRLFLHYGLPLLTGYRIRDTHQPPSSIYYEDMFPDY